jgi:hypothetical protein
VRRVGALFLTLGLGLSGSADLAGQSPAPSPRVRASIALDEPVVVGQPVTVSIEVLVPTFFRGAPQFSTLDVDGAITFFNARGSNFTEREGGATWAGQRRSYTIYPNRAQLYEIAPIPVEVRFGDGSRVVTDTVFSDPLSFEAVIPEEARGLRHFVAAADLSLQQSVDPSNDTLRVGDSFTRTLTTRIDGTLSMVIPPLAFDSVSGLGVYPSPPRLDDAGGERGTAIVGTRTESVHYVAEREGAYQLPPVTIDWWDWSTRQLRTAEVPGVTFTVVANPNQAPEIALPPDSLDVPAAASNDTTEVSLGDQLRRWLPRLVLLTALLTTIYRLVAPRVPRWRAHMADTRQRRSQSEAAVFHRFERAAASGDPRATANAFAAWLSHIPTLQPAPTAEALLRAVDDTELAEELARLDALLFGADPGDLSTWSGDRLAKRVAATRKHLGPASAARRTRQPAGPLAPLNP